jgi:List-Bact-rpt repeat protein
VPVTWCGGTSSSTDRPDIVGGDQIHVIYATPSDSPDRFLALASAIATDLNAINTWWKGQDPTRALRFDLAGFSCTGFGALDITDVKLAHDSAYYNVTTSPRLALLRADLVAAGFTDPAKKYLVYFDQAQPSTSTDCGAAYVSSRTGGTEGYAGVFIAPNLEGSGTARGCGSIEASGVRGGYLAVVAAHELINDLGALDTATPGPPHRCPGDPLHPCDSNLDVLAPNPSAATIGAAILDYGHDDYYAHSGTWWDVQDSPWLRHLDAPEYALGVTVGIGGASVADLNQPSVSCTASCRWTWADGSQVNLSATAASGYVFERWTGCPSVQGAICTVSVGSSLKVGALFVRPLSVASFHLSFARKPYRLTASITLNRDATGEADFIGCSFGALPVAATRLPGYVAACTWAVPDRFRGHRIQGTVEVDSKGETLLTKRFHIVVPRAR